MPIMEYHILSGRVIETRRSYMKVRARQQRGTRVAGASSARKIAANEKETVKRLARSLNCNFGEGLLWVTLKYDNKRLPESYQAAQSVLSKFLRGLRAAAGNLAYVAVTANWSPERKCPARLHHHLVLPMETSLDSLRALWPAGELYIKTVKQTRDLTTLAAYMLDNVHNPEAGKKKYSCSKGLKKPIFTEPKAVEEIEGVEALPGTAVVDGESSYDEDGRIVGSYIRAVAAEAPKVRGSMVILPKRTRRRAQWDTEALAEISRADD